MHTAIRISIRYVYAGQIDIYVCVGVGVNMGIQIYMDASVYICVGVGGSVGVGAPSVFDSDFKEVCVCRSGCV